MPPPRPEAAERPGLVWLLRTYLGPARALVALVVVLQSVQTVATLLLPAISADLIDNGVLVGDDGYVVRRGVVMAALSVVQLVFASAAVWFGARVAMAMARDVRRDLFHQVMGYSAREVSTFGPSSLTTRITNDVQQVQLVIVMALTMLVAAPLTMVIGVVAALRQDVGLSVVLVVSLPLAVLGLGSVVARMVPAFQRMQGRLDRVNQVMRERITGIRVVRAFTREPEEAARFAVVNHELTDASLRAGQLMAMMMPTVVLLINGTSVAVLWLGADRVADGEMAIGSLVAYLSYLVQILIAVVMATFMASLIPRAAVASERIAEVLSTPTSVRWSERPVTELPSPGTVEWRDVRFQYPGAEKPVLEGIDVRVGPGQTLAVVGSTGAGKTTLVNLLSRLMDVTEGAVLVGGVDVRELDSGVLWRSVGLVPQRAYLFSGTVATNLAVGRPDADEAQMWHALEIAQAADFVRAMPDGLDSVVAQGGLSLSGGQRQRLAIARALVAEPDVYVFDDSFSALDLATDERLRAALKPITSRAAVIVVAQRVATIIEADQILVLDAGVVTGLGPHDELVRTCPTYAEIVESQLGTEPAA